jgi:malate dehydrogenase (oxaloacetate-decarboxylating)
MEKAAMARRIFVVDRAGLVVEGDPTHDALQKSLAKPKSVWSSWQLSGSIPSFLDVIRGAKPTILIGVCAQGGAFTEEIVKEMVRHCERPIIFPLSNPTSKAEATPKDLIAWTQGRAVIATGSPFADVNYGDKTYQIGQCNNLYIFPAIGMGCLIAKATKVTEGMLHRAAEILAERSPAIHNLMHSLYPPVEEAPMICQVMALEVAEQAQKEGAASACSREELKKRLEEQYWEPEYPKLVL